MPKMHKKNRVGVSSGHTRTPERCKPQLMTQQHIPDVEDTLDLSIFGLHKNDKFLDLIS